MEGEPTDRTPKLIEDLGMRYPKETSKERKRYGLYECQYCGKEFETQYQGVKQGRIKSCGCLAIKQNRLSTHRLYKLWHQMKRRCYNKKDYAYQNYGGRGISVCERWNSIENFIEDMFPSFEEGLTLDRIDVDGNYEPDNCRWTTSSVQSSNCRVLRSSNTSGFRGVSWNKKYSVYRVRIQVQETPIHLYGKCDNPQYGALIYDTYVRENNLEHTKNFSDEDYYNILNNCGDTKVLDKLNEIKGRDSK